MTLHNHKKIDGFDYEVSEYGEVRSLPRTIIRSNGRPQAVAAKVLKPRWNGGHWQVVLYRDKNRCVRFVHHLVLEAFVGPRPDGMMGLHLDDDPNNNDHLNLYWGTMQDNALDRVRNGKDHNANKTHCRRGHLLSGDNLAPWCKNPNHRHCLSCNRANTLSSYYEGDENHRQQLSDWYFQNIMQGV